MRTASPEVPAGEYRSLCGRDYIVIPVVALVEGVRHAGGSPTPELVMATSFGRHVETWNGRPVVVNHPVNSEGVAVLASSPEILSDSYLGELMNATIADGKLVVEVWLDVAAIKASDSKGVSAMAERLEAGEIVEVSVGAVVYTRASKGEFSGKKYSGVWDIVIPDHLAFLDGGQLGACSVEDGCGTFRTQAAGRVQLSEGARRNMAGVIKQVKSGGSSGEGAVISKTARNNGEQREACDCDAQQGSFLAAAPGDDDKNALGTAMAKMLWQSDTFDQDRRAYLQRALAKKCGAGKSGYVVTYSDRYVVYETYLAEENRYVLYQLEYESGADNNVTLIGEPVEVVFQSKTVTAGGGSSDGVNKGKDQMSKMLAKKKSKAAEEEDAQDGGVDDAEEDDSGKVIKGKKKKMSTASTEMLSLAETLEGVETLEDLSKALVGTPIHRHLASVLKVCSAARSKAVDVILKSSGGKHFTAEILALTDFDVLDKMALSFVTADRQAALVLEASRKRAADAAASDDENDADEGGEEVDEEEDEGEVEGEDPAKATLSLGFMDYEAAANTALSKSQSQSARLKSKVVKSGASQARLAAPGSANFGGKAAPRNLKGGAPAAPDMFRFDPNTNKLIS